MDNFKFNFLSRGQLESLNLDKFLLTAFKTITCHRFFSSNLIFAIIARMLCGNHLNSFSGNEVGSCKGEPLKFMRQSCSLEHWHFIN